MSFHKLNRWALTRLAGYERKSNHLQSQFGLIPDWQHRYLTESLLSEVWLTWCLFSRHLIHKSLRGTNTRDNQRIPSRLGDNTWKTIGHQSSKASKAENHLSPTPASFLMRREPTWGDIDSIIKIINTLSPANKNQLLTAFGLPFTGPKHLQQVRNCAAHKTVENLQSLRSSLALTYDLPLKATPSEVAWSFRTGTPDVAIHVWLYELKTIADVATSTY